MPGHVSLCFLNAPTKHPFELPFQYKHHVGETNPLHPSHGLQSSIPDKIAVDWKNVAT